MTGEFYDAWHPYTQQHGSGVHVNCRPARPNHGTDSANSCKHGGAVERWHAHDYEGLLVCGCDDFSTAEGI